MSLLFRVNLSLSAERRWLKNGKWFYKKRIPLAKWVPHCAIFVCVLSACLSPFIASYFALLCYLLSSDFSSLLSRVRHAENYRSMVHGGERKRKEYHWPTNMSYQSAQKSMKLKYGTLLDSLCRVLHALRSSSGVANFLLAYEKRSQWKILIAYIKTVVIVSRKVIWRCA